MPIDRTAKASSNDPSAVVVLGKGFLGTEGEGFLDIGQEIPHVVACGDQHTLILTETGKLYSFGANEWGQLGLCHKKRTFRPTLVSLITEDYITYLACGRSHSLLLTAHGKLLACGNNEDYQLGVDVDNTTRFSRVLGLDKEVVTSIAAGAEHSCAITEKGLLFVWGTGTFGQLGLGTKSSTIKQPKRVHFKAKTEKVTSIDCGAYHTVAILESGDVFSFGEVEGGKLGIDTGSDVWTPQKVCGVLGCAKCVACGLNHTLILTDEGLFGFGDNTSGQLGQSSEVPFVLTPCSIMLPDGITHNDILSLAAGETTSVLVLKNGSCLIAGKIKHTKYQHISTTTSKWSILQSFPAFQSVKGIIASCGASHIAVILTFRRADSNISSTSCEEVSHNSIPKDLPIPIDVHALNSEGPVSPSQKEDMPFDCTLTEKFENSPGLRVDKPSQLLHIAHQNSTVGNTSPIFMSRITNIHKGITKEKTIELNYPVREVKSTLTNNLESLQEESSISRPLPPIANKLADVRAAHRRARALKPLDLKNTHHRASMLTLDRPILGQSPPSAWARVEQFNGASGSSSSPERRSKLDSVEEELDDELSVDDDDENDSYSNEKGCQQQDAPQLDSFRCSTDVEGDIPKDQEGEGNCSGMTQRSHHEKLQDRASVEVVNKPENSIFCGGTGFHPKRANRKALICTVS